MKSVIFTALIILALACQAFAADLLLDLGFENDEPIKASGNAPEIISTDAREGTHALKSQISESSPISYRTEFTMNGGYPNYEAHKSYWIGVSIKLDEDFATPYPEDDHAMLIQWHYRKWLYEEGSVRRAQPLLLRWDNKQVNVKSETLKKLGLIDGYLYSAPPAYGEWVDWVFHICFSEKEDGFFKVYRNGKKVVDYSGPNHYEEYTDGAYCKVGLYSSQYKTRPTKPFTRTVYHDCIRVDGPDTGSYETVKAKSRKPEER